MTIQKIAEEGGNPGIRRCHSPNSSLQPKGEGLTDGGIPMPQPKDSPPFSSKEFSYQHLTTGKSKVSFPLVVRQG